jgi:hypothetical protein
LERRRRGTAPLTVASGHRTLIAAAAAGRLEG